MSCPLILLPGFLGSKEDFKELESLLSFPCLSFDLPASIDDLWNSTKKFKSFHLLGYSMGGRIALQFKLKYPEKVQKLILISTHLGLNSEEEKQRRIDSDLLLSKKLIENLDEFLEFWYAQELFSSLRKRCNIFQMRKNVDVKKMAKALVEMSLGKQGYLWDQIPKNTSFILGELDQKYKNLYKNTPHKLVLNAGHAVHLEEPKMSAKMILEILND